MVVRRDRPFGRSAAGAWSKLSCWPPASAPIPPCAAAPMPVAAPSPMPGCVRVSGPIVSCFRRRAASAPADAARWSELWLAAPASGFGAPPWRASIASTSCPLRIRPAPGMPSDCAMRCNSGMSSEERPAPPRLRDLDVGAPLAADGAEVPTGASSDTPGAPLRSSVVSLTNGPSMILGRLGEPARPVDPVQRPPLGPELIRAALIAAECPRIPQRLAFLHASPCPATPVPAGPAPTSLVSAR